MGNLVIMKRHYLTFEYLDSFSIQLWYYPSWHAASRAIFRSSAYKLLNGRVYKLIQGVIWFRHFVINELRIKLGNDCENYSSTLSSVQTVNFWIILIRLSAALPLMLLTLDGGPILQSISLEQDLTARHPLQPPKRSNRLPSWVITRQEIQI